MIVNFKRNSLELIAENELEESFIENTLKMWNDGDTIVFRRANKGSGQIALESDSNYDAVLK